MREIQRLAINKLTGDATLTTEVVDEDAEDADTAERFRQLKAGLPEPSPDAVKMASVRCDCCGGMAKVDFDEPKLPAGWTVTPDGDYCPRCSTAN